MTKASKSIRRSRAVWIAAAVALLFAVWAGVLWTQTQKAGPPAPAAESERVALGPVDARKEEIARIEKARAHAERRQSELSSTDRAAMQPRSEGQGTGSAREAEIERAMAELAKLRREVEGQRTTPTPARGSEHYELRPAKVAWNTPPDMRMQETAEVEVRATLDQERFPAIESRITAKGATRSAVAELSRSLSATLSSTAFDVEPKHAIPQIVRPQQDAAWKWVISPKAPGVHQLLLTITATAHEGPVVEPLTRTITVRTAPGSGTEATVDFVAKNWEKLLTVVLLPAALWTWRWYRKRKADISLPRIESGDH